jgi:hypothetical protein
VRRNLRVRSDYEAAAHPGSRSRGCIPGDSEDVGVDAVAVLQKRSPRSVDVERLRGAAVVPANGGGFDERLCHPLLLEK